jgi:hypothetical protein
MDNKNLRNLFEAYGSIYSEPMVELDEEQIWEEVEDWVNSLIEEGYDLSDYSWEDMYDAYIEEQGGQRGSGASPSQTNQSVSGAQLRYGPSGKPSNTLSRPVNFRGGKSRPTPPTKPPAAPTRAPVVKPTGSRPAAATPARPATPVTRPTVGARPAAAPARPAAPQRASSPANATTAQKISGGTKVYDAQRKAGDFKAASETGSKVWAAANPKLANKPKTPNPLMQKTFGYQTGGAPDQNKPKAKTGFGALSSDYMWGSNSKVIEEFSDAYNLIYESKKVDQDEDGDGDFADVKIARLIASGMSKEEAIKKVKNKSYNEEYKPWDFGPKQKAQAKHSELAARKAAGGSAPGTATRANKIASVGREMRTTLDKNSAATGANPTKQGLQPATPRHTAAALRGAGGGMTASKAYNVKPLKSRGGGSSSLGGVGNASGSRRYTPGGGGRYGLSGIGLADNFELWINELLDEGYDLSEYTLDEMYEIYEETELDEAAKRTSKRVRGAKDEKSYMAGRSDAGKRISGDDKQGPASYTSRLFSKSPTTKPGETPKNTPKVSKSELNYARTRHKDVSGKDWNKVGGPKGLPEDFELWVETLLDEGYDLSEYTLNEMYEIYEETKEEKEARIAARRARVKEMEQRGQVLTSAKRASARAKERREEKRAEQLEKLANKAIESTRGSTRRSSVAMGTIQTPKPAAPSSANRKLGADVKKDTLAANADKILRMLRNEDFQLWLDDLVEEGYDLDNWTPEELVSLYENICETIESL